MPASKAFRFFCSMSLSCSNWFTRSPISFRRPGISLQHRLSKSKTRRLDVHPQTLDPMEWYRCTCEIHQQIQYFMWNDIVLCPMGHFCRFDNFSQNPSCRWLACLASCSVSFVSYRAEKLKHKFVLIGTLMTQYNSWNFKRVLDTAHVFKQGTSWLHVNKKKLDLTTWPSFNSIV